MKHTKPIGRMMIARGFSGSTGQGRQLPLIRGVVSSDVVLISNIEYGSHPSSLILAFTAI